MRKWLIKHGWFGEAASPIDKTLVPMDKASIGPMKGRGKGKRKGKGKGKKAKVVDGVSVNLPKTTITIICRHEGIDGTLRIACYRNEQFTGFIDVNKKYVFPALPGNYRLMTWTANCRPYCFVTPHTRKFYLEENTNYRAKFVLKKCDNCSK